MFTPNENQKIFTSSDNFFPARIDVRAVMPRNVTGLLDPGFPEEPIDESAQLALIASRPNNLAYGPEDRAYLLSLVQKKDATIKQIEEILENHSFDYEVDTPTVVEAGIIRVALDSIKRLIAMTKQTGKSSMDDLEYTYKYEFQNIAYAGRIRAECITEKEK